MFRFNFLFLFCHNTVLKIWSGVGTETTWWGLEKYHGLAKKIPVFVASPLMSAWFATSSTNVNFWFINSRFTEMLTNNISWWLGCEIVCISLTCGSLQAQAQTEPELAQVWSGPYLANRRGSFYMLREPDLDVQYDTNITFYEQRTYFISRGQFYPRAHTVSPLCCESFPRF